METFVSFNANAPTTRVRKSILGQFSGPKKKVAYSHNIIDKVLSEIVIDIYNH